MLSQSVPMPVLLRYVKKHLHSFLAGSCLGDGLAGSRCAGSDRAGSCTAAGGQTQRHGQRQQQRNDLLHNVVFPHLSQDSPFSAAAESSGAANRRSFPNFHRANFQNHLLCGSKFTIIGIKIPLRVQRNCRRAVGVCCFPTDMR